MRGLLEDASQRAIRYIEGVDRRKVAPSREAVSELAKLERDFPEDPTSAEEVLAELDRFVSPATMAIAGPRFFGFVIGGSLPAALAANWLAGAWDQNSAYYDVTPGTAWVEELALRWLIKIFKLPPKSGGAFVTGATLANFTALAAARHVILARAGWNVESDGLIGAPEIKLVVGAEAHPTLQISWPTWPGPKQSCEGASGWAGEDAGRLITFALE
jgi:glutamate/tyrosine decarboxylase-like PLP-dependent enzyme